MLTFPSGIVMNTNFWYHLTYQFWSIGNWRNKNLNWRNKTNKNTIIFVLGGGWWSRSVPIFIILQDLDFHYVWSIQMFLILLVAFENGDFGWFLFLHPISSYKMSLKTVLRSICQMKHYPFLKATIMTNISCEYELHRLGVVKSLFLSRVLPLQISWMDPLTSVTTNRKC